MSKIFTVFGATGHQGGSVIRTVLADPVLSKQFKVRGITRDTTKPAAKALADQADLTSVPSIVSAITGTDSVFLVTTPTFTENSTQELTQGKNVADAAQEVGVKHIVYSSLLHVTKTTNGRLKDVPHFDHKAEVEQYIRDSGLHATFVLPGYFMSNYVDMGMIRKGEDGVFSLTYPVAETAKFPLIDIDADMGKYVAAAFKNPTKHQGAQILAATDYYPVTRILAEFEEVTGHKTRFVKVDNETYKSFMPGYLGLEMLENHLFVEDPGYYNGRSLTESQAILADAGFKPTTWKDFVQVETAAFP